MNFSKLNLKKIFKLSSLFFVTFISNFIFSCSKSTLPDFNKLETIRILAFQTNTPEVNPGATVTLTPIISDLSATTMSYSVRACLDPGISVGADPSCDNNSSTQVIASTTSLTAPGAAENWTGAADTVNVTVPASGVIFSGKTAAEKYNGVSYIVEYTLSDNLGNTTKAIKRIIVSDTAKTSKNSNPSISQIYGNGANLNSISANTKYSVSSDLSLSSAETYLTQLTDGSLTQSTENLAITWFITDGSTKYYRSTGVSSNEYTTPEQLPSTRSVYLIAIARDDRGGLSFIKKKF